MYSNELRQNEKKHDEQISHFLKNNNTRQRHLEPLHGYVFNTESCALQMRT